jgi:hypothetical protein
VTEDGRSDQEARVGVIPGYALLPRSGLCDTTVYYRNLGG